MSDKPETNQLLKIGTTADNNQPLDMWIRRDAIESQEEVEGYTHIKLKPSNKGRWSTCEGTGS